MSISFAAAGLAAIMALAPAADVKPCKDPVVDMIRAAGWKGADQRIAYGVAWRESNLRPTAVGAGSYGLFQLQASVWQGTKHWPADPLDGYANAAAAHGIWKGTRWKMWGLNSTGDGIDATYYGGWDSATQYAWIWQPYTVGLAKYDRLPRGCRS